MEDREKDIAALAIAGSQIRRSVRYDEIDKDRKHSNIRLRSNWRWLESCYVRLLSNVSSENLAMIPFVDGFRTVPVRILRYNTAFLLIYLPFMLGIETDVVPLHEWTIRPFYHANRCIRIFFHAKRCIARISLVFTRINELRERHTI